MLYILPAASSCLPRSVRLTAAFRTLLRTRNGSQFASRKGGRSPRIVALHAIPLSGVGVWLASPYTGGSSCADVLPEFSPDCVEDIEIRCADEGPQGQRFHRSDGRSGSFGGLLGARMDWSNVDDDGLLRAYCSLMAELKARENRTKFQLSSCGLHGNASRRCVRADFEL